MTERFEPFVRVADLDAWARFAAVNDEFVAIHMDDAAGRAAGLDGSIAMGNLTFSHFHVAIGRWFGQRRIERISIRFVAPVVRGTRVEVRTYHVTEDEQGRTHLRIEARDAADLLLAEGAAVVLAAV